jgi:hypothetical protein
MAKRMVLHGAKCTLLVRDLAAVPDGEVEGEQPDDPIDERPSNETGA